MSHNGTAFHVAHGTGLPVPLRKVTHTPRRRESSAPPFLRRSAEVLAALDAGPVKPPQVRSVTRVSQKPKAEPKSRREPREPRPDRWALPPEDAQKRIVAFYLAGNTIHDTSREFGIGEKRFYKVMAAQNAEVRMSGGANKTTLTEQQILDAYELHGSVNKTMAALHTNKHRISRALRKNGIEVKAYGGKK